jgi:hypothetical protein
MHHYASFGSRERIRHAFSATNDGQRSRWMGKSFAWQRGFAAFSVSASNKDAVVRYIRAQDAHHKKMIGAAKVLNWASSKLLTHRTGSSSAPPFLHSNSSPHNFHRAKGPSALKKSIRGSQQAGECKCQRPSPAAIFQCIAEHHCSNGN